MLQALRLKNNKTLTVYLFFLFLYLVICSGHIGGDSLSIYFTSESLLFDGDFDLINLRQDFGVSELETNHQNIQKFINIAKQKDEPYFYSQYGLFITLVYTLFYAIGYLAHFAVPFVNVDYVTIFFVSLANCFISALFVLYFYLFAKDLIGSEKRALFLSIVFGFGTFVVEYALKSGFSEPMQGLTLFASFYHVYRYNRTGRNRELLYSGLYGAASILTKMHSVIAVALIGIFLLMIVLSGRSADKEKSGKKNVIFNPLLSYAIPIIFGVAIFMFYNYARYGTINEKSYMDFYDQSNFFYDYLLHFFSTAFNLLISPGKGLFIFAPVTVLSFFGFRHFYRLYKIEALICGSIIMAYFLFFMSSIAWAGEWSWGPRYLYIIVPFLMLPICFLLSENLKDRWMRTVKILFVVGCFVQLPAVVLNNTDYIKFSQKAGFDLYRIYLVQFSPVVGGYVRLASTINRQFTGSSLSYPVAFSDAEQRYQFVFDYYKTDINFVSLEGFDNFDLWISNVWRVGNSGVLIKLMSGIVFVLLLMPPVLLYRILKRQLL